MKQSMTKGTTLIVLAVVALLGCSESKPAGPAERIGKGVHEILGGVRDLGQDSEWTTGDSSNTRESQRTNASPSSTPTSPRYDQPYIPRCDPRFDPQCDDPYWTERDKARR